MVEGLRARGGGPWDGEQTLGDVRACVVEEAHEVGAALASGDPAASAEELGDLLFQVVFIGRLGAEQGSFHLQQVAEGIHRKMVERHPHVFGDAEKLTDGAAVAAAWEKRKLAAAKRAAGEQAAGEQAQRSDSLLSGVPKSLPALTGAYRLTQKAAAMGFDWENPRQVLAKVREELAELEEWLPETPPSSTPAGDVERRQFEELGDVLFAVANLARHLGHDPESALAQGNLKFRRRFGQVEADFADRGCSLSDASLDEMDAVWRSVKEREASGSEASGSSEE